MTLRRQLLVVSLLTLLLPWAGCQFIRETESALRAGQQDMLAGTARAIADSLSQYREEFPPPAGKDFHIGDQLFGHDLETRPVIDGYVDDWPLDEESMLSMTGADGQVRALLGVHSGYLYLFVSVTDRNIVYLPSGSVPGRGYPHADRVELISVSPPYLDEAFVFAAEAPGRIATFIRTSAGVVPAPSVHAHWQDVPGGFHVEARIPERLLGVNLGLAATTTTAVEQRGATVSTFNSRFPGRFVRSSAALAAIGAELVQPGMRLLVTDQAGWRLAEAGELKSRKQTDGMSTSVWLRRLYDLVVEPGTEVELAAPAPSGREQQTYVRDALDGQATASWFRSGASGNAIVAVARPIEDDGQILGAVVLQQGTDAILSLTNAGLARLLNVTVIATLAVALGLLGYATWLSRRIRRLSTAAEAALTGDAISARLPSADAPDEVGDLSRSFSNVLNTLGEYNAYLRTLASRLSHELRTPLAIVTSSLDNLDHEPLPDTARQYTDRARDGAERLRRILNAMSEANRAEELMRNADMTSFDLEAVLRSAAMAYRDAYPDHNVEFSGTGGVVQYDGSPELLIQMIDKLVDNATSFAPSGAKISLLLEANAELITIALENPGPPLPEKLNAQLFDSLVSLRKGDDRHLGLGLYIARLVAEGHGGTIAGHNTGVGVRFEISLPRTGTRAEG